MHVVQGTAYDGGGTSDLDRCLARGKNKAVPLWRTRKQPQLGAGPGMCVPCHRDAAHARPDRRSVLFPVWHGKGEATRPPDGNVARRQHRLTPYVGHHRKASLVGSCLVCCVACGQVCFPWRSRGRREPICGLGRGHDDTANLGIAGRGETCHTDKAPMRALVEMADRFLWRVCVPGRWASRLVHGEPLL